MHCNVWVLLTRQCMCAIDNCSVILGFGVQVNVLVVVFVHFKVFIGVKATFSNRKKWGSESSTKKSEISHFWKSDFEVPPLAKASDCRNISFDCKRSATTEEFCNWNSIVFLSVNPLKKHKKSQWLAAPLDQSAHTFCPTWATCDDQHYWFCASHNTCQRHQLPCRWTPSANKWTTIVVWFVSNQQALSIQAVTKVE